MEERIILFEKSFDSYSDRIDLVHGFFLTPPSIISGNRAVRIGLPRLDPIHKMYWEVSGNPEGVPVVFTWRAGCWCFRSSAVF